jgi:hypothetical protein
MACRLLFSISLARSETLASALWDEQHTLLTQLSVVHWHLLLDCHIC